MVALRERCVICRAHSWCGSWTGSHSSAGNYHSGRNRLERAAKKTIKVSLLISNNLEILRIFEGRPKLDGHNRTLLQVNHSSKNNIFFF